MATLAVGELSHDFRIGQTTGIVEFFSMTWTAAGDPHLTLAFLDGGRSTARSNDAKRSRHTQLVPRLAGQ
jgi:hypothetical protein